MGYTQIQESCECCYWTDQLLYHVGHFNCYLNYNLPACCSCYEWIMNWCWCCGLFPVRTDCCFSPDDKLLVTGTSVKKDEGNGKLVFFDRASFQRVYEIEVTSAVSSSSVSTTTNALITRCFLASYMICWLQTKMLHSGKKHIMNTQWNIMK